MINAKRRVAALEHSRKRLVKGEENLRKLLAELRNERHEIKHAIDEHSAQVLEADDVIKYEQGRIDEMTRLGEHFSIEAMTHANHYVDAFAQKRTTLAVRLDQLIEAVSEKDKEIARVRRKIAMTQVRREMYEMKIDAIRNEVSLHRENRAEEEAEELVSIRRWAIRGIDE
ncbi:hypothetical protein [Burkholderia ubonensis]|uniref:hypothetical protein n=1 Tax=Burkholderia ubonensis TaxID=101571 RepID=UPI0009B49141|nr:hypothetical protein [Burkholderia ubonensis]